MQTETPKFKEWLAAEKEAQAAELELHAAMPRFARGTSGPPVDELVRATRAKRTTAHRLFDAAMLELRGLAESLHHRRIVTTSDVKPAAGTTGRSGLPPAPPRAPTPSRGGR